MLTGEGDQVVLMGQSPVGEVSVQVGGFSVAEMGRGC